MADAQREKLIALIMKARAPLISRPLAKKEADALLSGGVIVPPCNVGDTVYIPWEYNGTNGIACVEVTHILIKRNESCIKTSFFTDDDGFWLKFNGGCFDFDDFGKTVFLSREEAEKAQKGGAEKCR